MIEKLAWVSLISTALNVVLVPLVFGRERKPYGYQQFCQAVTELVVMLILCGRVFLWW